jgi:hypothetical protein
MVPEIVSNLARFHSILFQGDDSSTSKGRA